MPASSKEFLDIQATIECRFNHKRVHDTIRTYSHNILAIKIFSEKLSSSGPFVTKFHIAGCQLYQVGLGQVCLPDSPIVYSKF